VFAWILSNKHTFSSTQVSTHINYITTKAQLQHNSLHYTTSFKPGVYIYIMAYITHQQKNDWNKTLIININKYITFKLWKAHVNLNLHNILRSCLVTHSKAFEFHLRSHYEKFRSNLVNHLFRLPQVKLIIATDKLNSMCNIKSSQQWVWGVLPSGMWKRVLW